MSKARKKTGFWRRGRKTDPATLKTYQMFLKLDGEECLELPADVDVPARLTNPDTIAKFVKKARDTIRNRYYIRLTYHLKRDQAAGTVAKNVRLRSQIDENVVLIWKEME